MALYPIKGIRVGGDIHPIAYDALHGKNCVEFTEQTLTDEQKRQARLNIDAPVTGDLDAAKKQIENLKKIAQGKLYDFQVDDTEAYVKDVPTGAAPYAAMKAIGGKSIVLNQLIPPSTEERTQSGITIKANGDGSFTLSGTATDTGAIYLTSIKDRLKATPGNKYFAKGFSESADAGWWLYVTCYKGSGWSVNHGDVQGDSIFTAKSGDYDNFVLKIYFKSGTVVDQTIKPVLIDLTKMFGSGNEPATVEEVKALFPADYYEYNEGEIISAEVQNVKSLGVNLFDIERFKEFAFENGGTVTETTAGLIANKVDGKTLFSGFKPNTRYAIKFSGSNSNGSSLANLRLVYTNGITVNMDFSDSVWVSDANKSVDKLVGKWFTGTATFNLNDCYIIPLEDGQTADTVELKPYKSDTLVIPEDVKQLEGYGWSAGSVCNSVDFERKKFIKRVERYVLTGDEGGTASTTSPLSGIPFTFTFNKLYSESKYPKIVENGYGNAVVGISDRYPQVYGNSNNWVKAGNVGMYRDSINFGFSEVKTKEEVMAMLPITFYYELAEPEEIDISDILTDDNLIEVEAGGTLTFENIHGDSFRLPVPSSVEYMVNLEEATA